MTNDDVTSAVMSDTDATPKTMTKTAMKRPPLVSGTTSPYPTVVTVCAAHQSASPRLVEARSGARTLDARLPASSAISERHQRRGTG